MSFSLTPDQLRRAQVRGGLRHGRATKRTHADKIIYSLRGGPKLLHELAADVGKTGSTLAPLLNLMLSRRQVIVIGTAEQAGRAAQRRKDARMWALPGTPMLKRVSVTARKENVAPSREPWPFRELHRKPFEFRDLAMKARR